MAKNTELDKLAMSKFIVKTELSNIIQLKDGTFSYNEEIVSMKWNALEDKEKSPRKEKKKPKKKKIV